MIGDDDNDAADDYAVPALVWGWGLIPVLDFSAGLWNYYDWNESGLKKWENAYVVEMMFAAVNLVSWTGAIFLNNQVGVFYRQHIRFMSFATVGLELINLYLVYRADDYYPNEVFVDTPSKLYAYVVHAVGLVYSAATIPVVNAYFAQFDKRSGRDDDEEGTPAADEGDYDSEVEENEIDGDNGDDVTEIVDFYGDEFYY